LIISIEIIFLRDKINIIKIVPIIVGNLTEKNYEDFETIAKLLLEYFKNESSFFIFSSEFCILKETITSELNKKYGDLIRAFVYRDDFIKVII
jgi:predicted class III extradiol MEMO1 family dioxygenase